MAGGYEFLKLLSSGQAVDWQTMLLGLVVSGITGYACIHVLLKVIEKIGLLPFTLYRIFIAAIIVMHFG